MGHQRAYRIKIIQAYHQRDRRFSGWEVTTKSKVPLLPGTEVKMTLEPDVLGPVIGVVSSCVIDDSWDEP